MNENLLEIRNLRVYFNSKSGTENAVDGIDMDIKRNEVYGIVGESGSGKTLTALSILRLLPPQAVLAGGTIMFEDSDLLQMSEPDIRTIRGSRIAMVFQEPASALNPVFTVGYQIMEAAAVHQRLTARRAKDLALEYMRKVRIPSALKIFDDYPHQISGGTKQRIGIAMALINSPELIILDEPTTALDVTIQAEILDLLCEIVESRRVAALLISHDFGVISRMCDRVSVMCKGSVVEAGRKDDILRSPKNIYTQGLLKSVNALL